MTENCIVFVTEENDDRWSENDIQADWKLFNSAMEEKMNREM